MNFSTLSNNTKDAFYAVLILYFVALAVSIYHYSLVKKVKIFTDDTNGSEPHATAECQSPLLLRLEKSAGAAQAVVYVAVMLHFMFMVLRGLAAHRLPWSNLFEYTVLFCFVSMLVAAIMIAPRRSWAALWPWILTPNILLMFYAGVQLYVVEAPVVPALKSGWYYIHVTTVSVGGSIGLVSGVFSVLYLLRVLGAKRGEDSTLNSYLRPLPSAKMLDELAYKSAIWALPSFGLGIIFGAIWADAAWGRFWGWDPKETVSFITWILYAAYLHARATPGTRGVGAAWINVVAFITMIFNLFFINQVVSGLHSYAGLN